MRRTAQLALLPLALAATTTLARARLEPEAQAASQVRNPAWLPDGRLLRAASFGQRLVVADLYWLKLVQYVGETVLSKTQRWDALYPLADIVTDLDPRYGYAYEVAGSDLGGVAHRYDEADQILLKGMKNVPDRWMLPFIYASNKFLFEQDYATAAAYARRAAEVGNRPHLALLAANLSALVDTDQEYGIALAFLDQALAQAEQPELREQLDLRRAKIRTYQVLSQLERALAAFRRDHGRQPIALGELLGRYVASIPEDPSGGELVYDPIAGTVQSTRIGPRAPIRVTPK